MSFMQIMPTKSELLRLKKRLQFLKMGQGLLQLKAESLLLQIKDFHQKTKQLRDATMDDVIEAFKHLKTTEIRSGEHALKALADVNKDLIEYVINISFRSALGFTVPKITFKIEREKRYPHYGFIDTNFALDEYYKKIQQSIESLLKLAELENTLFIMANEYRKLRRRINALDKIIIPTTDLQINMTSEKLDEDELEEFIRQKKIKTKIKINKSEE
ncbi:MAG: V-type ATP synthase subunit D [Candidatus Lokiarchaeota archaeon]|nr:V-type ATP synthase subunit D [Candidatus Lokiarchaeota archaeon]